MRALPDPFRVVFLGGPGVSYNEYAPPPQLAPWIAAYWNIQVTEPFELRILPDGCIDLIDGDVIGPFSCARVVQLQPGDRGSGIRLRPGAFPALFGFAARELVDARVPLVDLVPGAPSIDALARDAPTPDPLAEAAMRSRNIRDLQRHSGYSGRQLRRRLVTATGHGPKRLSRIGRMQAVLRAGRGESWARTATEYGYFDEAHMANDISGLAGATPHTIEMAVSSKTPGRPHARMRA